MTGYFASAPQVLLLYNRIIISQGDWDGKITEKNQKAEEEITDMILQIEGYALYCWRGKKEFPLPSEV